MEAEFAKIDLPDTKASIKRIDKWINYVVHHAWVKTGIFFIALLEATITPFLPEVFVAAILAYRKDISWKVLSMVSALGSATGAILLYLSGKFLYEKYQVFFDGFLGNQIAVYADQILSYNTFIALVFAAFTPLPDRVFAFISGIFSLNILVVFIAFFIGRFIRVGIVAYFSYKLGDEARVYILKHTRVVTISVILLIALYILYKYAF